MIDIDRLCLRAGAFDIRDVTLRIPPGEYFVLMGRTGSGKSLLVRCLCGLVRAEAGSIRIDGLDVTHLEPRGRQVGYMPQDCGLFPHMNVLRNILFSLRARGLSRRDATRSAGPIIEMLRLEPLLNRDPASLSGGERQKAALARALAWRPKALLLDEPVSALDEPTRREVCADLRSVQRRLGITTIHICHGLTEARGVADRAGVLHQGRLQQTGTLDELAGRPATEAVASLVHTTA